MSTSVVLSDITFAWPDGREVFDSLNIAFDSGRIGLVGNNGSGKSTLLKLITGELTPTRGSVSASGRIAYLRQDLVLHAATSIASLLGIQKLRDALRRIESGSSSDSDLTMMDGSWDIEERAVAVLDRLGLGAIGSEPDYLGRTVATLSGGETTLLGLAAQLLRDPAILLLDEPTNNLDRRARDYLDQALDRFPGTVIVVSHDRELLDRVEEIVELRSARTSATGARTFGGNFTHYRRQIDAEQEAAAAAVRDAEREVRSQKSAMAATLTTIDRRRRYGKKMNEQKREPKIVMGARKRSAQESAGKLRIGHEEQLAESRDKLSAAEDLVRDDAQIHLDLPGTTVHRGQRVLEMSEVDLSCGGGFPGRTVDASIVGPERIALAGANGIGKTTLLDALTPSVPIAYVRQNPGRFDDERSVLDNIADRAPHVPAGRLREQLARLQFRGRAADAPVGTLSGGERLRAHLAAAVLSDPPPQLLILDEPTNNLDIAGIDNVIAALQSYAGALLVVSHDEAFLAELGLTMRWTLDRTSLTSRPL